MSAAKYTSLVESSDWESTESVFATPQDPWLLLPSVASSTKLSFYDVFDSKTHDLRFPSPMQGGTICGSSRGWLFIAKQKEFFLFNPVSGDRHELPSLFTLPYFHHLRYRTTKKDDHLTEEFYNHPFYDEDNVDPQKKVSLFIDEIELSSEYPSHSDCVIAAVLDYGSVLVCCRPGDKKWTVLHGYYKGINPFLTFSCIGFCYKTLYAVTANKYDPLQNSMPPSPVVAKTCTIILGKGDCDGGYVLRLKFLPEFHILKKSEEKISPFGKMVVYESCRVSFYLAESSKKNGELILVHKHCDEGFQVDQQNRKYNKTRRFKVFKLTPSTNDEACRVFSIERITNLGNDGVLFVGGGSTLVHSTTATTRGNCIYFIDDRKYELYNFKPSVSLIAVYTTSTMKQFIDLSQVLNLLRSPECIG